MFGHPEDSEAFEEYYANQHLPLAEMIPNVQRFESGRVYAVDNGKYLDLLFHKIPTTTLPAFKDLMTQIATSYKPNVVTWKEVAQ